MLLSVTAVNVHAEFGSDIRDAGAQMRVPAPAIQFNAVGYGDAPEWRLSGGADWRFGVFVLAERTWLPL